MSNKEITVLGLGSMGLTIARLYLDKGYKVTVWNRTADKAAALVKLSAPRSRAWHSGRPNRPAARAPH